MRLPKLSPVEMGVGFFIQMPLYYLIGNHVFVVALVSAFLWALGGAAGGNHLFRRVGVPYIACLSLWLFYGHSWGILAAFFTNVAVVSFGYGEEAALWKFINDGDEDHRFADYVTRMLTYVAYWLVLGFSLFVSA